MDENNINEEKLAKMFCEYMGKMEDSVEALNRALDKALEKCPEEEKWAISKGLAICYRSKEEYDRAIKYLKKSLEKENHLELQKKMFDLISDAGRR